MDSTAYNVGDCMILTAKGFAANEKVNIYLDSTSSTPLDTASAGANGSFYDGLILPDIGAGSHTIIAKGVTSAKSATSPAFGIYPTIRRDPFTGAPGDALLITGRGFGANETVNVVFYLDAADSQPVALGSFTANATGSGTLSTTFPPSPPGLHDYYGKGVTTGLIAWGAMQIVRSVVRFPDKRQTRREHHDQPRPASRPPAQ